VDLDREGREQVNSSYDPKADALAIQLSKGKGHVGTLEVRPGVYLDFDEDDRLVAIELLDASFHVPKEVLAKIAAPSHPVTLEEAEKESGLSASTWRVMLNNGRVQGKKVGSVWTMELVDVWNYIASRDARGRRPVKRKARRRKVKGSA
jgi:uncharacterized protein YuzE